jgi:PAS domain S-box-containing protein
MQIRMLRRGAAKPPENRSAGAIVVRRLLPAAVVLPAVVAAIRLVGEQQGLYGTTVGVALFAAVTIVLTVVLVLWTARRIDALEASRAELESERDRFYSLSPDLLCIAGTDGYFKRVNPAFTTVLGYSEEELLAKPYLEFVHPDDRGATTHEADRNELGVATIRFENRYVCKDGSVRWLSWRAVPAGERIYATARDVTELKALERMKDEFIGLVSHELRTPLTSIRGYLELVLEGEAGELTEQQRTFLGVVDRNSERLLRLVGDLLLLAQIDAGQFSLDTGHVELRELAAECVEAAKPKSAELGVALHLKADDAVFVEADRVRLAQVFDNLVSNALKFSSRGDEVELRAGRRDDRAVIEVVDRGVGMSPAEQEQLFTRFFRSARASREAIPGTGLGLVITRAIVEAHGGRIDVESAEGVGTTFRVEVPVAAGRVDSVSEVAA